MGVEPVVVVVVIGGQVQGNDSEASQPNEWFPPKGRVEQAIRRGLLTLEGGTEVRSGVVTSWVFNYLQGWGTSPSFRADPSLLYWKFHSFPLVQASVLGAPFSTGKNLFHTWSLFSTLYSPLIKIYVGRIIYFPVLFLFWKYVPNFLSYSNRSLFFGVSYSEKL